MHAASICCRSRSPRSRGSRAGILAATLLALAANPVLGQGTTAGGSAPSPARPPYPCQTAAEHRQFDFWIGVWDVTPWQVAAPTPQQQIGVNDVHPILQHCVISENWSGTRGDEGKSYNYYDRNLKHWRQVWVADRGGVLDYTGDYRDGAMRFTGWTLDPRGNRVEQRLTFFNVAPDTVRQLFESSTDGGKSWTPGFDGRYVRRH